MAMTLDELKQELNVLGGSIADVLNSFNYASRIELLSYQLKAIAKWHHDNKNDDRCEWFERESERVKQYELR